MPETNDRKKLSADILKADLATYRRLETWGSSLFLGALGLVAKQILEWRAGTEAAMALAANPTVETAPAVVGLASFIFLRLVNYRGRRAGLLLRKLAGGAVSSKHQAIGLLGLVFALMPLALGYATSWFLTSLDSRGRTGVFWWSAIGAVVAVIVVLVPFIRERIHPLKSTRKAPLRGKQTSRRRLRQS